MASFSAFNTLQQKQLLSINLSKYPYFLSCVFTSSTLKHKFHQEYTLQQPFHIKNSAIMCSVEHKPPTEPLDSMNKRDLRYGFSSLRSRSDKVGRKAKSSLVVEEKMVKVKKYRRKREFASTSGFSSLGSNDDVVVDRKIEVMSKDRGEIGEEKIIEKCQEGEEVEKKGRKRRKAKIETPESRLRKGLDMCSKKGDFESAISLYDSAVGEGVQLEQYHYTVLLYLCSSAAVGVVRPAKSGKGTGSSFKLDYIDNVPSVNSCNDSPDVSLGSEDSGNRGSFDFSGRHNLSSSNLVEMNSFNLEAGKNVSLEPKDVHNLYDKRSDRSCDSLNGAINMRNDGERDEHDRKIQVSEDVKRYALARGFEIYEKMCSENIPLNEATLTSVARMAMSMGDGDMALDMVNKMKEVGIRPRLRSYGPALFTFCNCGDIEKAFMVEEHMLENGVYAEEPELEALLRLSVEAGRGDKVYKVLHTLRKSIRKVSSSTADLIERWFRGKSASRVGKRKWDKNLIIEAMKNRGGGWHGQGWLGRGKWTTARTVIGNDGFCENCGDKLVIIDLDPTETENFAESVAALAFKRERESSFQNFQKWLDYYGPFEAVVDAANVGLYKQRQFSPSKVNVVVNGIRQKLPSKKWPLIVLHNKRITGGKMEEPSNKILFEKWKNADALCATPTGSNDDWYWLYAAIKFKCLLVTNDEMRDHLFQLLGNDFFPRWKERHQVRFGFSERGLDLYMPPPCSVVIQESEEGHWHIPIASEDGSERDRTWLCVTRTSPESHESPRSHKEATYQDSEGHVKADTENWRKMKLRNRRISKDIQKKQQLKRIYSGLKSILSEHVLPNDRGLVSAIEEAEKLGGCVIDFQI